jgi:hypothetical protein
LLLPDPTSAAGNPFLHDRQRTYQPRDLWESLLKFAVLLFVGDVGLRRIYLDRAEWLKATATLRRWLFFWRGKPRPVEADESLAALLARRDQVRARHTTAGAEPRPELFRPATEADITLPTPSSASSKPAAPEPEPAPKPAPAPPTATTSRLLEAKRRAREKLDK